MDNIIKEDILLFKPIYTKDKGDCTKVVLENKESFILNVSITSFIKALYKEYKVSYSDSNNYYSELLHTKNLLPIVINSNKVYMPYKCRVPFIKNDRAFGYIKYAAIDKLYKLNGKTCIRLKNSMTIDSLSSLNSLNIHHLKTLAAQQDITISESKYKTCKILAKQTIQSIIILFREFLEKQDY